MISSTVWLSVGIKLRNENPILCSFDSSFIGLSVFSWSTVVKLRSGVLFVTFIFSVCFVDFEEI